MTWSDIEYAQWHGDLAAGAHSRSRSWVASVIAVAEAAQEGRWSNVLEAGPDLLNTWDPHDPTWSTPLHHAVIAPPTVIRELIDGGAMRSLRNAAGLRAYDVAITAGRLDSAELLAPHLSASISMIQRQAWQAHLDALITSSIGDSLVGGLRMPPVEILGDLAPGGSLSFSVPGFYGGVQLRIDGNSDLLVNIASRMDEGAGGLYRITQEGSETIRVNGRTD